MGTYSTPSFKSLRSLSTCSWNLRSSRAYLSENMKCPQPGKGIQHICRRSASGQQSSTSLKSSRELMVVTVGIIPCWPLTGLLCPSLPLVWPRPSAWRSCACGTAGGPRPGLAPRLAKDGRLCCSSGTCRGSWLSTAVPGHGGGSTLCARGGGF